LSARVYHNFGLNVGESVRNNRTWGSNRKQEKKDNTGNNYISTNDDGIVNGSVPNPSELPL